MTAKKAPAKKKPISKKPVAKKPVKKVSGKKDTVKAPSAMTAQTKPKAPKGPKVVKPNPQKAGVYLIHSSDITDVVFKVVELEPIPGHPPRFTSWHEFVIKDSEIIYDLREERENDRSLYYSNTLFKFDSNSAFDYYPTFKKLVASVGTEQHSDYEFDYSNENFKQFYALYCDSIRPQLEEMETLLQSGMITFDLLWAIFQPGQKIWTLSGNTKSGGKIKDASYRESWQYGPHLQITVETVKFGNDGFELDEDYFRILQFGGSKPVVDLPVKHMTPEIEAELVSRGKVYETYAKTSSYLEYSGSMKCVEQWFERDYRADGRVMIDIPMHSRISEQRDNYRKSNKSETTMQAIPAEYLFATPAYIEGFSFAIKKWGRFVVEGLTEIQFRSDAFDKLVMDPAIKEEVQALVSHHQDNFQDIITGKGGGCIFLLAGNPGVGKTLTCESIAELLKRPLYSVSVGELGVNTDSLEKNLRRILNMATEWNAVLLLDEADIFLEKRSPHDVARNAMVGIFLRLLEYHDGVLFLTTNRVSEFDPAFLSRISVGINYEDLDTAKRVEIWTNLLASAKITLGSPEIKALATHQINGRQIKNSIRIAQGLSKARGGSVRFEDIERVILRTLEFNNVIMGEDETEPTIVDKAMKIVHGK